MTAGNCGAKISEGRKIAAANGFTFGVQLHNSIGHELYDEIMKNRDGVKLSMHSPVFADYFINLAAPDFDLALSTCRANAERLTEIGSDILFFHGFFMTDKPLVHDMKNYRKAMTAGIGDDFRLNDSFIMNPAVFETELYQSYKQQFADHFKKLQSLFPQLRVALENDFIGMGSGLQRPQELHELVNPLWFDLGHFWCSSLLHGFDYYDECERVAASKDIVGVHINHNFMTGSTPKEALKDSHGHIYEPSAQRLGSVVRGLLDRGVDLFTLEIVDGNAEDLRTFFSWI
jgi:hypothetical protein